MRFQSLLLQKPRENRAIKALAALAVILLIAGCVVVRQETATQTLPEKAAEPVSAAQEKSAVVKTQPKPAEQPVQKAAETEEELPPPLPE